MKIQTTKVPQQKPMLLLDLNDSIGFYVDHKLITDPLSCWSSPMDVRRCQMETNTQARCKNSAKFLAIWRVDPSRVPEDSQPEELAMQFPHAGAYVCTMHKIGLE